MGVNLIFRIAAVGILVSVVCQVLKHSGRDEQAFLTSLAGLVLVLFCELGPPESRRCCEPLCGFPVRPQPPLLAPSPC